MIFRCICIISLLVLLIFPIYAVITFFYKKFMLFNEEDNLALKLEKNKEDNKTIKTEIENKINNLKDEVTKLTNVKENE